MKPDVMENLGNSGPKKRNLNLAIGNPKRTDFLPEKTFTRFQSFATK
jgi:hypothetical protein